MKNGIALLALAMTMVVPVHGRPDRPARAGSPDRPPFLSDVKIWQANFAIGEARYDRVRSQIAWELVAKEDVKPPPYKAFLTDADGVEQAVVEVRFEPAQQEYQKDMKLRAVARLPRSREGLEVDRLEIRKGRH